MIVQGIIVDVHQRKLFRGEIEISGHTIIDIRESMHNNDQYIMPGFIDSHIHIESSMLTPYYFAQEAIKHGTIGTISDPHEIANVNGIEGVDYMCHNARHAAMKIHFGAPSCVPATSFETAGAIISSAQVRELLLRKDIWYLSEMMNYPGVLHGDAEVMAKINYAIEAGKPVDGHAPGLVGDDAAKYFSAGITTDHECFTLHEALSKASLGMKILIREGSAARNFDALHSLLSSHNSLAMLCSDDKHPDDFTLGHINTLVKRAIALGHSLFDVLQAACVNPVMHYNITVGLLKRGHPADFIIVSDLKDFDVQKTYVNGICVFEKGVTQLKKMQQPIINNFNAAYCDPSQLKYNVHHDIYKPYLCIEALDGQLITNKQSFVPEIANGNVVSNTANDILKLVVMNRYNNAPPAVSFIKNFGLKEGAIASTVAHDSHNIIAVGVTDADIAQAMNLLVECKGGLSVVAGRHKEVLPLPIAGLMSNEDCAAVAKSYSYLDAMAHDAGSRLRAPFMTLSFMALLVIPTLKLSDKGLFDGSTFSFIK